jgi:hypothetical protein
VGHFLPPPFLLHIARQLVSEQRIGEMQAPEWQELTVDRRELRKMSKSIETVQCRRYKDLDCLRRDTALTNGA